MKDIYFTTRNTLTLPLYQFKNTNTVQNPSSEIPGTESVEDVGFFWISETFLRIITKRDFFHIFLLPLASSLHRKKRKPFEYDFPNIYINNKMVKLFLPGR